MILFFVAGCIIQPVNMKMACQKMKYKNLIQSTIWYYNMTLVTLLLQKRYHMSQKSSFIFLIIRSKLSWLLLWMLIKDSLLRNNFVNSHYATVNRWDRHIFYIPARVNLYQDFITKIIKIGCFFEWVIEKKIKRHLGHIVDRNSLK